MEFNIITGFLVEILLNWFNYAVSCFGR